MTIRNPKLKPVDYDALWKEFLTDFLKDSVEMLNLEFHEAFNLLQNNYGATLEEVGRNARATKKLQKLEKKAEQDLIQAICNLYSDANLSHEVIAKAMGLDIEYVQKVIAEYQKTKQ